MGGMRLTNWYSGAALCSASRAALMTGRQFPRVGSVPVFGPTGNTGIWDNETTVAQLLKSVGYTTAIQGKVGAHASAARLPPAPTPVGIPLRHSTFAPALQRPRSARCLRRACGCGCH